MPKGPFVCTNTQDIKLSVGSFHVPTPKEVKDCKELVEISSPNKQITSLRLLKSKSYAIANLAIEKELKLVEQNAGEEKIGGNSDHDDISDAATNEEFEEQEEHDYFLAFGF